MKQGAEEEARGRPLSASPRVRRWRAARSLLVTAFAIAFALTGLEGGAPPACLETGEFPTVRLAPLTATSRPAHGWTLDTLRERYPAAPADEVPEARIIAETWMEIYLPERAYDAAFAGDRLLYAISSSDDPAYAASAPVDARRPERVLRRHFPERAPFTPTTPAAAQGQTAADRQPGYIVVVYRIFLKMPASRPFLPGRTYTVSLAPPIVPRRSGLAGVTSLSCAFSGEAGRELIHANQEAYPSEGPKLAYLSGWLGVGEGLGSEAGGGSVRFRSDLPHWNGMFSLVPARGGAPVFTAQAERSGNPAEERYAGAEVQLLDFSSFDTPGKYRIQVPGVGYSYPFTIGERAFDHVVYTVMRGMTHLRDGDHGLDSPEVTRWNRPSAHLDDAIVQSTGLRADLSGGHMDAGDREKIPLNMALAASYYLVASRLFPDKVEALGESLQIPETGNCIPDFLDELFYELDCLYKMVAASGDGAMTAWIKPVGGGYEKGLPLEGAKGRVWFDGKYGHVKSATLAAAGALAMASIDPLVRKYSGGGRPERAAAYLEAAKAAWGAYAAHETDGAWWHDESTLLEGVWRLGRHPHSSTLIFAAANLFEATGDVAFLDRLRAEWPDKPLDLVLYGSDPRGLPLQNYLSVALSSRPEMPLDLRKQAEAWIFQVVDGMNKLPNGAPVFGIVFQGAVEGGVGWFFSGLRTGFPNLVAWGLARRATKGGAADAAVPVRYRDRLVACWNYLLGTNPLSKSHITGLGDPETRVRWPVNELWDYQWRQYVRTGLGWMEPPPGLVVGDLQHGDFGSWFGSAYNAAGSKRMEPSVKQTPLFYRHTDGWNVTNEASSHTAAMMAAIALPFAR